jgi:hypothetical protein
MQLRLFRHFVPISVVLLVSSDALLITCAFYQLLSEAQTGTPIVLGVTGFNAQFSAGLSFAAVATMISVGLYGQQSFMNLRLLFSKIAVASILVLLLVSFSASYWRDGLAHLTDFADFPIKATLIWLVLRIGNPRDLLGDLGSWSPEEANSCSRQRHTSGPHRQAGRDRAK